VTELALDPARPGDPQSGRPLGRLGSNTPDGRSSEPGLGSGPDAGIMGDWWACALHTASLTHVRVQQGRYVLATLNDCQHLQGI
jgi:hypothetical protein